MLVSFLASIFGTIFINIRSWTPSHGNVGVVSPTRPISASRMEGQYKDADFMHSEYLNVGDVGSLGGDLTNAASALCNMTQDDSI